MQSAGWTATTLNYFWPLAFGVFSCTAVASIVHQRKETTWWHWVLCITAGIFACNMEQMCGVLLFVYVTCFCYCLWRDKKLYVGLLLQLLSAVASTIFILKCPGNWVRMQDEVAVSGIQGFEGMNPVEKMLYGWNDTCAKALNERIVFAVTVTVLFILTLLRTKSLVKRLIALFPVIMVFYRCVLSDFFPPVSLLLVEHPTMSRFTIGSRAAWGMLFLWMLMLGCNAVTVTFLCDSKAEKIFLVLLLLTGLFSRVIVGQSGSLENSSSRTFLYFDFTLLFLMLFGIRKTAVEGERLQNGLRLAYAGTALFCMINTFVFAARLIA